MKSTPSQNSLDALQSIVSFEISPCPTNEETSTLIKRLKGLQFKPALVGVACHDLGACLSLAREVRANGFEVMIHIPAGTLTKSQVSDALDTAKNIGLRYILALRGDKVSDTTDFPHAADLVEFIREKTGKYFTIAVGGYPDMHPEAESPELDIFYLKKKVDCGADFVLSQVVFSSESFNKFVFNCREVGITVPIVPGILLIQDLPSLQKFVRICRVELPEGVESDLMAVGDDAEDLNRWACNFARQLASDIFEAGTSNRAHFFTMNRVHEVQNLYEKISDEWQRSSSEKKLCRTIRTEVN